MTENARNVLHELMEGNRCFRSGRPHSIAYSPDHLRHLAETQRPQVAIIACSDSRVSPDVVFDQPLGTIFASRVPGNVASDSAKWMLEIAITEFKVPLVMVLGHTGCLAVGQLLDGDRGGAGGMHRFTVLNAVYKAKAKRTENLYDQAIEENVAQTVEQLLRDLYTLRSAVLNGSTSIMGGVYQTTTGEVQPLEIQTELYGRF